MRAPHNHGFTFFEVILALALLGIALLMLVQQSADGTRADSDRAARMVAHRTVRNEVQRLRASDVMTGAFPSTFHTDRAGSRIAAPAPGAQAVVVERRVRCLGGDELRDNATAPSAQAGCAPGTSPLAEFTLRVVYPSRYTPDATGTLVQTVTLWPRDRHGTGWSPGAL
ncbi:MAG TPA: prepilin-type N-terminal cleavage/methylation domain-containing protein [Longimicrobium sp.]